MLTVIFVHEPFLKGADCIKMHTENKVNVDVIFQLQKSDLI